MSKRIVPVRFWIAPQKWENTWKLLSSSSKRSLASLTNEWTHDTHLHCFTFVLLLNIKFYRVPSWVVSMWCSKIWWLVFWDFLRFVTTHHLGLNLLFPSSLSFPCCSSLIIFPEVSPQWDPWPKRAPVRSVWRVHGAGLLQLLQSVFLQGPWYWREQNLSKCQLLSSKWPTLLSSEYLLATLRVSSSLLLPSSSYTDAVCVLWLMVVWPHLPIVWGP